MAIDTAGVDDCDLGELMGVDIWAAKVFIYSLENHMDNPRIDRLHQSMVKNLRLLL